MDSESSATSEGLRSESSSPEIQNVSIVDDAVVTPVPNREYFKPLGGKIFRRYPKEG